MPPRKIEIIAFTDSNSAYWGETRYDIPVISPNDISKYNYDRIIVASIMSYEVIAQKLRTELGVPEEKIDISYVSTTTINRDKFLNSFAGLVYENKLMGNVAECGVCEGIFAKKINTLFSDRTLYLFDTFEGFDERDIEIENIKGYTELGAGHLGGLTSEDKVRNILPYPEKAIIRKGYFPETAEGIEDIFVFVNLDFDLYKPTLSGLNFFWPRMTHGGVILVHDFFFDSYSGVKSAVNEFCKSSGAVYMPIADEMSVAFIKY